MTDMCIYQHYIVLYAFILFPFLSAHLLPCTTSATAPQKTVNRKLMCDLSISLMLLAAA